MSARSYQKAAATIGDQTIGDLGNPKVERRPHVEGRIEMEQLLVLGLRSSDLLRASVIPLSNFEERLFLRQALPMRIDLFKG
jgi:hypothetical protein